jgi:SAM-dependent methyltransferase
MNSNPVEDNDSAAAYAALARFYDLQHATYTPDVAMYEHFAAHECAQNAPILEVGCGTGRVMIPLVQAGYAVVGVDESPQMLEIARGRLANLLAGPAHGVAHSPTLRWRLVEADIRQWKDDGAHASGFGMAFIALNTFLHNLTREQQMGMLTAIRQRLAPGGLLLVDLPPNDELSYQPDDGEYEFEATLIDSANAMVIDKFVASRVSWATQSQTLSYRMVEKAAGETHTQVVTFHLRHIFKHEMELLLLHAGFRDWQWYGDYDLSEYADGSPRMIVAARV